LTGLNRDVDLRLDSLDGPGVVIRRNNMAGTVVRVVPKTKFSVNGAASSSNDIAIGPRAILTSDWTSGVLVVRLHTKPA
jgi:hypothetical protein